MVNTENVKKSIIEIAKLLFENNLIDASGGNISVRDDNKVYVTCRKCGSEKQWNIDENSIVVTDLCGIPIMGDIEKISREANSHFYIYRNFPDINAVIHAHPVYMTVFSSAHMDIPSITETMRGGLGNLPITNIKEVPPSSKEQERCIVENFKQRRKKDPDLALICNLPFHGAFSAGRDINEAYSNIDTAENSAKILIYRELVFRNNPKADFSIHFDLTKEHLAYGEAPKEYCKIGYSYIDAFGNKTTYTGKNEYKQLNKNK